MLGLFTSLWALSISQGCLPCLSGPLPQESKAQEAEIFLRQTYAGYASDYEVQTSVSSAKPVTNSPPPTPATVSVATTKGAVETYYNKTADGAFDTSNPIHIYRNPEALKGKPEDLSVLVLGTQADADGVAKAVDYVNPITNKPYDVIIGPGLNQLDKYSPSTWKEAGRSIDQNREESRATAQSEMLMAVLQKEFSGGNQGELTFKQLDMHSNGTSITAPLLAKEKNGLKADAVQVYGPAMGGGDLWALDRLIEASGNKKMSINLYADIRDVIPAASGGQIWVSLGLGVGLEMSVEQNEAFLLRLAKAKNSKFFKIHVMDNGPKADLFGPHDLATYFDSIRNGRELFGSLLLYTKLEELLAGRYTEYLAGLSVGLPERISFDPRPLLLLPNLPPELRARIADDGKKFEESELFAVLRSRQTAVTPEMLTNLYNQYRSANPALYAQANDARTRWIQEMYDRNRGVRDATKFRVFASGSLFGGSWLERRPCPGCGGRGRLDLSARLAGPLNSARQMLSHAEQAAARLEGQVNSTKDIVQDSRGKIITDNRAWKASMRQQIASWRQQAQQCRQTLNTVPKDQPCPTCGGSGRLKLR